MLLDMNKLKQNNKKDIKVNNINITKISLIINSIFIAAALIMVLAYAVFHVFDYKIVEKGLDIMCNNSGFRERVSENRPPNETETELKIVLASLDYSCPSVDAQKYFNEGLDKYLESLGLSRNQ